VRQKWYKGLAFLTRSDPEQNINSFYTVQVTPRRRALGDQATGHRKSAAGRTRQGRLQSSVTSRSRSADLYLSMM
jgi:hypothetical protein